MGKKTNSIFLSIFIVSFFIASNSTLSADFEGATFGVDIYGSTNADRCCPGCDNLQRAVSNAEAMATALNSINYDQTVVNRNQVVDPRDFTNNPTKSWGKDHVDPRGTDFADVIFYMGHGNRKCKKRWYWSDTYYSSITMGDYNNKDCFPRTDKHMRFGEGGSGEEANILIEIACQSMHHCVWDGGGYSSMKHGDFNIINGFHGYGYDMDYSTRITNYVQSAEYNGLGDDWVDDFTEIRLGSNNDICATSMTWGSSNQFYLGGFRDFKKSINTGVSFYFYINGCDPQGGKEL